MIIPTMRARIMIVPTEDMIEEIASPQNRLKPPFAETWAKFNGLLTVIKA